MSEGQDCIRPNRVPRYAGARELFDDAHRHGQPVFKSMLQPSYARVLKLGQGPEAGGLPLVARERKKLGTGKNLNFQSMMVANADAAHVGRDHAIGSNNNAIWTVEGNDNSHPWKTLFTFISGYLL
jgi:hypothetical protein